MFVAVSAEKYRVILSYSDNLYVQSLTEIYINATYPEGTKPLSASIGMVVRPEESLGLGPGWPFRPHHDSRVFSRTLVQEFRV